MNLEHFAQPRKKLTLDRPAPADLHSRSTIPPEPTSPRALGNTPSSDIPAFARSLRKPVGATGYRMDRRIPQADTLLDARSERFNAAERAIKSVASADDYLAVKSLYEIFAQHPEELRDMLKLEEARFFDESAATTMSLQQIEALRHARNITTAPEREQTEMLLKLLENDLASIKTQQDEIIEDSNDDPEFARAYGNKQFDDLEERIHALTQERESLLAQRVPRREVLPHLPFVDDAPELSLGTKEIELDASDITDLADDAEVASTNVDSMNDISLSPEEQRKARLRADLLRKYSTVALNDSVAKVVPAPRQQFGSAKPLPSTLMKGVRPKDIPRPLASDRARFSTKDNLLSPSLSGDSVPALKFGQDTAVDTSPIEARIDEIRSRLAEIDEEITAVNTQARAAKEQTRTQPQFRDYASDRLQDIENHRQSQIRALESERSALTSELRGLHTEKNPNDAQTSPPIESYFGEEATPGAGINELSTKPRSEIPMVTRDGGRDVILPPRSNGASVDVTIPPLPSVDRLREEVPLTASTRTKRDTPNSSPFAQDLDLNGEESKFFARGAAESAKNTQAHAEAIANAANALANEFQKRYGVSLEAYRESPSKYQARLDKVDKPSGVKTFFSSIVKGLVPAKRADSVGVDTVNSMKATDYLRKYDEALNATRYSDDLQTDRALARDVFHTTSKAELQKIHSEANQELTREAAEKLADESCEQIDQQLVRSTAQLLRGKFDKRAIPHLLSSLGKKIRDVPKDVRNILPTTEYYGHLQNAQSSIESLQSLGAANTTRIPVERLKKAEAESAKEVRYVQAVLNLVNMPIPRDLDPKKARSFRELVTKTREEILESTETTDNNTASEIARDAIFVNAVMPEAHVDAITWETGLSEAKRAELFEYVRDSQVVARDVLKAVNAARNIIRTTYTHYSENAPQTPENISAKRFYASVLAQLEFNG